MHVNDMITAIEATQRTGVSLVSIHYWVRKGYLPGKILGHTLLVSASHLEAANRRSLQNKERQRYLPKQQAS